MNPSDYEPTAVAKGYFSRAALIQTYDSDKTATWNVLIERASDRATLWTTVTILDYDNLETRTEEAVTAYVSCKIHNAFGRFEDMVTRRVPADIEESKGMFENAVCMQERIKDGKFSFLERVMQAEFEKYLSGYGCSNALAQRV